MKKKIAISIVAVALVLCCAIGGTLAWLTAKTDSVTNTFTVGDIKIDLKETTGDTYKLIPGSDLAKDPKVTVEAGSEACWLFVKVTKENWNDKVGYEIADGWAAVEETTDVYYRQVGATTADTDFNVLKDNKITVSSELTREELQAMATAAPTLTFKAAAVQQENMKTVGAAYEQVKTLLG